MSASRFLVISLGNQAPFFDCLHSAGHFALAAARQVIAPSQPPFSKERYGGKSAAVSSSSPFIFAQSPTMMNNCGPWIHAAWKDTLKRHNLLPSQLRLILVHDELEADFGTVRTRDWAASARGHNGIKSAKKTLDGLGLPCDQWARIMVGIGRPEARTSDVVADHVLSRLTSYQKGIISDKVGAEVVMHLYEMSGKCDS